MKGQRVAAHLIGKPKGNQIEWEFTPMNTFKDPELILKDNSLVIPQKGLYFVYTQVVYTGKDCKTMKSTELTHTVMREGDYGEPTPLLTSTKTACDAVSGNIWHQPIYQGGIFLLEEGDILSTETTKINLLNMNKGQVYFGVIAL
ncbi:PREDICTED: tumor necrosis factor-like [Nanorana parkeri]|uniref:tumor necrosis factor-like n=1 Tax=Nanorana parkeri TaxID=125878 RepID=UPI0008542F82|nr:PREDICTED: tumor necrosis factor-like [Nanorana parkeri]